MRLTRAALRAEGTHADVTVAPDASSTHADNNERVPLRAISANTATETIGEADSLDTKKMSPRKARGKSDSKRGTQGKRGNTASEHMEGDGEAREDEHRVARGPASDATADHLATTFVDSMLYTEECNTCAML